MKSLLALALMGVLSAPAPAQQFAPPPPVDEQVARLRAEVADLRGAVARIEARLTPEIKPVVPSYATAAGTGSVTLARTVAGPTTTTTVTREVSQVPFTGLVYELARTTTQTTPVIVAGSRSTSSAVDVRVSGATRTPVHVAVTSGGTSRSGPVRRFLGLGGG